MIDEKYAHILHLPHHRSTTRPSMSLGDRGAQFAPFSALAGHAEGTEETARTTQMRRELSQDALLELDETLHRLEEHLEEQPQIAITYFLPDGRKEGGSYPTTTGKLRRIDRHHRTLILTDRREIPMDEIVVLEEIFSLD